MQQDSVVKSNPQSVTQNHPPQCALSEATISYLKTNSNQRQPDAPEDPSRHSDPWI